MYTSNDSSIDLENPAASLRREIERIHRLSTKFCIFRVPNRLRSSNEKFYTPRIVSIGPLHHDTECFKAMEFYKRKCLKDFLERTKVSLEVFVEFIRKKESKLRAYYAENIALSSHDFVKMILVDASFIFEVLFGGFFGKGPIDDRVYNKPWLLMDVMNDLFVLENQLPFFILEDLLSLANIEIDHERVSMIKITHKFSCEYWDICKIENLDEEHYSKVGHFVDFVRIRALPSNLNVRKDSKYTTIPKKTTTSSVIKLRQAGVKLKIRTSKNLFNIRFSNGKLEIPLIRIRIHRSFVKKCFCF
ncbi:hypothetical protein Pint_31145 [Pistacia integerrima]|uniref:Uncharacterized protein n=1 Tax=Pistacia integerrima TaxID=434235 RepID=A0ACC0XSJ6_9ROSI|nr:hypothetical protein Pint_31145 [Pistacia integerrima]